MLANNMHKMYVQSSATAEVAQVGGHDAFRGHSSSLASFGTNRQIPYATSC